MQKRNPKNPQPNLFSILDNGNIATNNPAEESDKINAIQDPLPYAIKTQINKASMISRDPIEWAKYLSFEKRVYKDNSKEDVNFFANGEIKESSRVYEANKEGFERRITKRYDLIDTIRNREFFTREIEILTHTNSLEELKEQGLEIQLTHHNETHKKTLENGNEIAKEYDYIKDIYQEVEKTKDGKLVREIIPSISSAECFKLYDKLPFESVNNENTKLNTSDNEEVKKLEFELAKEVHTLILEQQLLSATDYYSWIDKDDYANFAWKMHRLINENKLKENHLSADNANKIKQFFFNNGFILGWTKEEISAIQENASMSEELTHKKLKEQNKQIAEQNKEKLDAIKKQFASNLNDLFLNEEEDYKLLEYKGFVVNAYKTKYQVEFSLSPKDNPNIAYCPSNMVYKNDTSQLFSSYNFCGEIKFDGFLKRLDNAITKLPEKIKELENSIETTQENIAKYTRLVEQKPPYPRLEYLQTLKWDHKTLIDDLAKMGKDRDYKPVFNLKSKEVLEKMNAEKRASLENEGVTEEVKEQANQEAHRPMKKAANDDYDMGM